MEVTPDEQKEFFRECGARLRAKRLATLSKRGKPLTLAEAAALIGRPDGKGLWRKWEKGAQVWVCTATEIAEALGTTVADIWGRARLSEVEPPVGPDEDDDAEDDEDDDSPEAV